MYDHNGLELSPADESRSAYRHVSVNIKEKKFCAYSPVFQGADKKFGMATIKLCKDVRDASFIAREFIKIYDKHKTRQMVTDGTFRQTANDFCDSLEIPEWQYDAEGFTIEELINGGYDKYKTNYAADARSALLEIYAINGKPRPNIAESKKLIAAVEAKHKSGMTYRAAAEELVG